MTWEQFVKEMVAQGLTPADVIKFMGRGMKDVAYREEYNNRPEVKEKRAEYNKRTNQEKAEARRMIRELTSRGVDVNSLLK